MAEYRRIGEMLLSKGKLTQEQLNIAIAARTGQRRRLGRVLTALGFVTEKDVAECLGEQYGLEVIDPGKFTPDPKALDLLGGDFAFEHTILLLRFSSDSLECVISDPIDFPTTDLIAQMAGRRTVLYLSPRASLVAAIRAAYGPEMDRHKHEAHHDGRSRRSPAKPSADRQAILTKLDALNSNL
jgi:type IV pilus assembly protein PilB